MSGGTSNDTWPGALLSGTAAHLSPPPRADLREVPDHIGPYAVEELLGRGGMAAVYRCRDERGEPVAVKWLDHPSPALQERFAREIASLARVGHPSIVRYLGHGTAERRPYLVMEVLDGDDLRLWSHRLRRLPAIERGDRVRALAVRLAGALGYLHERGLVHRDVKPSNILVLDGDLPVLTDFGVVKDLADHGETLVGVVIGTPNYASPEQLQGTPIDPRSDLYSLGCTLYFVLTGKVPFESAGHAELVMAHLGRAPVPPSHHDPTIPADLEQAILRLMAKHPEERFQSAAEFAEALSATPVPAGVPLAGRKAAMAGVAEALERVAGGRGCVLCVSGPPGTGKTWVLQTLREGAHRRGLTILEPHEPAALQAAMERLAAGEVLLVATEIDCAAADVHIRLEPLRRADLRRSVVAVARDLPDPAGLAERLFRATGGLPVLLLPLLEALARDPRVLDGPLPRIQVDRWLDPLDLDSLDVLQAVAAAGAPLSAAQIEAITQVPAEEPLHTLLAAGLLVGAGGDGPGARYSLAAEAFGLGALERVADLCALRTHVAQVIGATGAEAALPELATIHRHLDRGALGEGQADLALLQTARMSGASESERLGLVLAGARLAWLGGRVESAQEGFQQALDLARPGSRGASAALIGLGMLAQRAGRAAEARERLEAAVAAAREAGSLDMETLAGVGAAWNDALSGRPGPALRAAGRLAGVARALGAPAVECATLELQGRLLLELGLPAEAARVLADISALAHAAGLARERWQAHVLRAQATLDQDHASPTTAAAAMDRLLRVFGEPPSPDPLGYRGLAHALRARAAARLSDSRTFAQASRALTFSDPADPVALIARLQLARACWVIADLEPCRALLHEAERLAGAAGWTFLAWQARRLRAALRGAEPEPASELLEGMEPRWAEALAREPERA
jgi:tetratricopeptide (TPR) repeat protein